MHAQIAVVSILGVGCAGPEDTGPHDSGAEPCAFSFALLTDTHVGEGASDHGGEGWDDEGGDGGANAATLEAAVAALNALPEPPAFALVLGDLTDSGERSELDAARAVLAGIEVPWLPLLGNHDTWPYAWDEASGSWDEAGEPVGDALLREVFAEDFAAAAAALPGFALAEPAEGGAWVDFSFDWCGLHVAALDTNPREHTGGGYPGVGPEGVLEGPAWDWLQADLRAHADAQSIAVFSHQPFVGAGEYTFSPEEMEAVATFLEGEGLAARTRGFFAGHIHIDTELEGPAGVPVVLTAATKDGTPPRVVSVDEDGSLDWEG